MAVCADTFRRPKGKGGTRMSPTTDVSTLRIEDSQVAGVGGSSATTERFSNQRIRVSIATARAIFLHKANLKYSLFKEDPIFY